MFLQLSLHFTGLAYLFCVNQKWQTNHVWNGKISLSLKISLLFGDIFNSCIQLLCLCFSPESPFLTFFTHKFEFYIFLWAKPMQVQSPDPYCTLPDSALPLKSFTPNTCSPFALFRFTRFLKEKIHNRGWRRKAHFPISSRRRLVFLRLMASITLSTRRRPISQIFKIFKSTCKCFRF